MNVSSNLLETVLATKKILVNLNNLESHISKVLTGVPGQKLNPLPSSW